MLEIGFLLFIMIFSGYAVGQAFVKLISKIRSSYDTEAYLQLILCALAIPLLPILYCAMVLMSMIGVQFYYILTTGQF